MSNDSQLVMIQRNLATADVVQAYESFWPEAQREQAKRELYHAAMIIAKTHQLAKIYKKNPGAFIYPMQVAAQSGLTLAENLGQAYLIPYGDEVKFQPSYKGLVTKMESLGLTKGPPRAEVIYEGDIWKVDYVTNQILEYVPHWARRDKDKPADKGEDIACFVLATLASDGSQVIYIRGREYYDGICEKSQSVLRWRRMKPTDQAGKTPPLWLGPDRPAMIRKTMIKYLWEQIPKPVNIDFQRQQQLEAMAKLVQEDNMADTTVGMDATDGQDHLKVLDKDKRAATRDAVKAAAGEKPPVEYPGPEAPIDDWLAVAMPEVGLEPPRDPKKSQAFVKALRSYLGLDVIAFDAAYVELIGQQGQALDVVLRSKQEGLEKMVRSLKDLVDETALQ
jgi:recombination protein RecT